MQKKYSLIFLFVLLCGLTSCRQHRTPKKISFIRTEPNRKRNEKEQSTQSNSQHSNISPLALTSIVSGAPSDNLLLEHTGFVVSYNPTTGTPSWVAWELTSKETTGTVSRDDFDFMADPLLDFSLQIDKNEYRGSGYDRGHMCPAGDMEWSIAAMNDCHYMTNICPQKPKLNQIYWERLESACRRWANRYGSIYIVCGPIYYSKNYDTISKNHTIGVPNAFFKVIICLIKGEEKGIGFIYKNEDIKQTMEGTALSIDHIEELVGYDFFPNLPDEIENSVEAVSNLSKW